jgi:predicted NUDIX family phosphoesterase
VPSLIVAERVLDFSRPGAVYGVRRFGRSARGEWVEEHILCFKREILRAHPRLEKTFYDESLWHQILANLESMPRSLAEHDYTYKQLVVYTLLNHEDVFLSYQRTPKTAEARLKDRYSIGIGGHVNIHDRNQLSLFGVDDASWNDFLLKAVWREVNEEVQIDATIAQAPKLICFINDDSNDVGQVHFGVVWLVKLAAPSVTKRGERGIGRLSFQGLTSLSSMRDTLESWSQLLVDYLLRESSVWQY